MPSLVIDSGKRTGETRPVGARFLIGRSERADLALEDPVVSRLHAVVLRSAAGHSISDLNSHFGTLVNGVAITASTPLRDGDRIQVGPVRLLFQDRSCSADSASEGAQVQLEDDQRHEVVQVLDARDVVEHLVPEVAATAELEPLKKRLHLLTHVAAAISRTLDRDSLLMLILDELFQVYPQADSGAIVEYDNESEEIIPRAGRTRELGATEVAVSRTLVRDAIADRRGVLSRDASGDDRFSWAATVQELRIRSVMCVPMIAQDEVYGAIQIHSSDPSQAYTKDDMALLMGIARQAALSLANSRLHEEVVREELLRQDLELAHRIQLHLVPRIPPEHSGFSFRHHYSPALEVSGDYFGYFPGPDGNIGIAIGDVAGKGVSAALYMAQVTSMATSCFAACQSPGAILAELNARLVDEAETGMFMTMAVLSLDTVSGELRTALAGHPPPLVRHTDGAVEELECPGNIPLGVEVRSRFDEQNHRLKPGEAITLYTDGVTEAESPNLERFGLERLIEVIAATPGEPETLVRNIVSAVDRYRAGEPPSDDVAVICLSADSD